MDKAKLRGLDIVSGLVFVLFALFGFFETFQMPMTETYGGVSNVWYVSPALFPLFVNSGILILGAGLVLFAVREGGAAYLKASYAEFLTRKFTGIADQHQKFAALLVFFCGQIYVFMPTIDFYLSMVLFITVFISAFYFEDMRLLRRMSVLYLGITAFVLVLRLTGGVAYLEEEVFEYAADLFVLVFLLFTTAFLIVYCKGDPENKRKSRTVLLIAYLAPLVLILLFKFILLIPMPHEGGFIEMMSELSYQLRSPSE